MIKYQNITSSTFETAVEMFTYLIICPQKQKFLSVLKDTFHNLKSVKEMILAINSIKKESTTYEKEIINKIWTSIMQILDLKYYKRIDFLVNSKHELQDSNNIDNCTKDEIKGNGKCKELFSTLGKYLYNLYTKIETNGIVSVQPEICFHPSF